ncbi:MAG: M48 family metallopeptidase [Oscillospiraceae bacterium]
MEKNYKLIRSKRRTITLSLDKVTGQAVVKAGLTVPIEAIDDIVRKNDRWIAVQQSIFLDKKRNYTPLSTEEIDQLKSKAQVELSERTSFYGQAMGVAPTGIKITSATTRWGSCSGKNSICYSYRVMLLPKECQDYIVVHELAHIKVKNHSKDFYNVVGHYLPNYKALQKEIKNFRSCFLE